jgi:drug/metabolite transporter (DMT)-like permease
MTISVAFCVSMIWALTFALTKVALGILSPSSLVLARSWVAVMGVIPLVLVHRFVRQKALGAPRALARAAAAGGILYVGYCLQSLGMEEVNATQAGFILGLTPLVVPFLGVFVLGVQVPSRAWRGLLGVLLGLPLLSAVTVGEGWSMGLFYCLLAVLAFAIHVLWVQQSLIDGGSVIGVMACQAGVTALLATLSWSWGVLFQKGSGALLAQIAAESAAFYQTEQGWNWALLGGVLYCGWGATLAGGLLQCWVQRRLPLVTCALVFATEPVFSAGFSYLLLGETLSQLQALGAVFVLLGVLEAEVGWLESFLGLRWDPKRRDQPQIG